jgi:glutamine amidotransferase
MVQPRIALVDYEAGNLHSVQKACTAVGLDVRVTGRPEEVAAADAVILPGVGSFPACMRRLRERGLVEVLQRHLAADRPFLGICLGLQLLFARGEEGEGAEGLAFFPGRVRRLRAPGRKIPHMGWNALHLRRADDPLFTGVPEGSFVYFVHSYQAEPEDGDLVTATTDYGEELTAAVGRGAVRAVQFHPEKSSAVGLRILDNFGRLLRRGRGA